jgi:hypothetical protein
VCGEREQAEARDRDDRGADQRALAVHRVCRTTATTNAPTNCRISRRRRVAAAA